MWGLGSFTRGSQAGNEDCHQSLKGSSVDEQLHRLLLFEELGEDQQPEDAVGWASHGPSETPGAASEGARLLSQEGTHLGPCFTLVVLSDIATPSLDFSMVMR